MVKKKKERSAFLIALLYGLILIASMALPETLSNYNAFLYLAYCLMFPFYRLNAKVYVFSAIFAIIVGLFSVISDCKVMYIAIDAGIIFYLLASMDLIDSIYIKQRLRKIIIAVLTILLILSVLNTFNPEAYAEIDGDVRYTGIFIWGNTSACMFAILSILFWKLLSPTMKPTGKKILVICLTLSLVIYYFASQTRTLLFVIPYWIYQLFVLFRKQMIFFSLLTAITMSGPIIGYLEENSRMEEDSSYITRSGLYLAQIAGIWDNYVVIPHGANCANDLVYSLTGDTGFSPHNDFLRYTYDWGIVFIFIVFYISKIIKKYKKINIEIILIFIGYSGFALHNLLFLPYVWIPLIFILMISETRQSPSTNKKTT